MKHMVHDRQWKNIWFATDSRRITRDMNYDEKREEEVIHGNTEEMGSMEYYGSPPGETARDVKKTV